MSVDTGLSWPDSTGAPLRPGDRVQYTGSITSLHGTWVFEGPCQCGPCDTEYFDMCDRYRPMRSHIPQRHVLTRGGGQRMECVPESGITAVARRQPPGAAGMLTVDAGALAPWTWHSLWLLEADGRDGHVDIYGERTVRIVSDWRGTVIEMTPCGRFTGPPRTIGGVQLWRWEESAECLLAVFGDQAAMQAGARALAGSLRDGLMPGGAAVEARHAAVGPARRGAGGRSARIREPRNSAGL